MVEEGEVEAAGSTEPDVAVEVLDVVVVVLTGTEAEEGFGAVWADTAAGCPNDAVVLVAGLVAADVEAVVEEDALSCWDVGGVAGAVASA